MDGVNPCTLALIVGSVGVGQQVQKDPVGNRFSELVFCDQVRKVLFSLFACFCIGRARATPAGDTMYSVTNVLN